MKESAPVRLRLALRSDGRRLLDEFIMTLGNGYLGSYIDEERSKMRYLV